MTKSLLSEMDKRFDQLVNVFIGIVVEFSEIVDVTVSLAIWG